MVVVERAAKDIGSSVEVEFTRALQTQAGKMLFAKKTTPSSQPARSQKNPAPSAPPKPHRQPVKTGREAKPARPQASPRKAFSRKRSSEDSLVELANK